MRILCLANSYREGGRCVAGIELNRDNKPIIHNGRPKWIRPICDLEHPAVPNLLASNIAPLSIIEFEVVRTTGDSYHSENVLINKSSFTSRGHYPATYSLDELVDNDKFHNIFGNRGAAVPEDKVGTLTHSLLFLKLTEFEINEIQYDGKPYPKVKLTFKFRNNTYSNITITDPLFLDKYNKDKNILEDKSSIYVTISLGALFENWASKLIACLLIS